MENTSFDYRLSSAQIRLKQIPQFQKFAGLTPREYCFGAIWDGQDATITMIRGGDVPKLCRGT
eukprot:2432268-Pyramimonas_sp.AAC.1